MLNTQNCLNSRKEVYLVHNSWPGNPLRKVVVAAASVEKRKEGRKALSLSFSLSLTLSLSAAVAVYCGKT